MRKRILALALGLFVLICSMSGAMAATGLYRDLKAYGNDMAEAEFNGSGTFTGRMKGNAYLTFSKTVTNPYIETITWLDSCYPNGDFFSHIDSFSAIRSFAGTYTKSSRLPSSGSYSGQTSSFTITTGLYQYTIDQCADSGVIGNYTMYLSGTIS